MSRSLFKNKKASVGINQTTTRAPNDKDSIDIGAINFSNSRIDNSVDHQDIDGPHMDLLDNLNSSRINSKLTARGNLPEMIEALAKGNSIKKYFQDLEFDVDTTALLASIAISTENGFAFSEIMEYTETRKYDVLLGMLNQMSFENLIHSADR